MIEHPSRNRVVIRCTAFGCTAQISGRVLRQSPEWLRERLAERWNGRAHEDRDAELREALTELLVHAERHLPADHPNGPCDAAIHQARRALGTAPRPAGQFLPTEDGEFNGP